MKYKYCLEMIALNPYTQYKTWRWTPIAVSNDLKSLKALCTNKHRIVDLDNLKEIYRTAPKDYHASFMELATTT